MTNVKIFFSIIGLLILGGIAMVFMDPSSTNTPSKINKYDGFAHCLKDKGATFYGAFWCPHCQTQKKLFGSSVKLLPYVECSTADGKSQTLECIAKGIQSYPTWIFADGSQLNGEIPLATLAEKTSCVLPE